MRTERLPASTPELDAEEAAWWERFAPVCEELWTLDEHTAAALRDPYLRRAARYLVDAAAGGARVLDLGCGSGFTARRLAAAGADVLAIDISSAQIELARAAGANGAGGIEYRVQSAAEVVDGGERFAAVLTHAFLHHLASDELDALLADIRRLLVPGGRAWFYEPVFYPEGRPTAATVAKRAEAKLANAAAGACARLFGSDERPLLAAQSFYDEADDRGWFLSPKEVPFRLAELVDALSAHFEVEDARWATTTSYPVGQAVALLRADAARRVLGRMLVRPWARLDLALGGAGRIGMYRGLPGYGFMAVSCQRLTR